MKNGEPSRTGERTGRAPEIDQRSAAPRAAAWVLQLGLCASALAILPFDAYGFERYATAKELVLHLTAVVCCALFSLPGMRLQPRPSDALLAGYVALGAASAFTALNPGLAARAWGMSTSAVVVFLIARQLAADGYAGRLVAAVAVATTLIVGTVLFEAYWLPGALSQIGRVPGGTAGNRNFAGHMIALTMPPVALLVSRARGRGALSALVILASALTWALLLTRSRAAWLGAVTAAALLALLWMPLRCTPLTPRRVIMTLGGCAAGAVMALTLPDKLGWRSPTPYADTVRHIVDPGTGSGRGRVLQYATSIRMMSERPLLGVGPGNWPVHYPRFAAEDDPSYTPNADQATYRVPSSDWVGIGTERGALALALLAGFAVFLCVAVARRDPPEPGAAAEAATLIATLGALAVVGAFDCVLLLPGPALATAVTLGTLSARPRTAPRAAAAHVPVFCVAPLAAILLWTGLIPTVARIRALDANARSTTAEQLDAAAALDPGDYQLQMDAGHAWAEAAACSRVRVRAGLAHALFPFNRAPRQMAERCAAQGPP